MAASTTKKIAYNTAVQVIGKIAVLMIAAVSVAIVTRYLGVEGYGKFTLALVYLSFFGTAADLGLFTISLREISRHPERAREIVGNTLGLRMVLSTLMLSVAIGIGWLLPYDRDVHLAIMIGAVSVFFGLLNSAIVAYFQSRLKMHLSVLSDVIGRAAAFGAVVYVVTQGLGFFAVVATAAVGTGITLVISYLLARQYLSIRLYRDLTIWKEMTRESIPLGAALVLGTIYFKVDVMMLSFLRTPAEVGIYSAVYKILDLLMPVPGFFVNSVFPQLVKRLKADRDRAGVIMEKSSTALLILGLGLAFGGLVVAEDILRLIGGEEFVPGADALRISLFALAINFYMNLFGAHYIAENQQVAALKLVVLGLFLNVGINLWTIPTFGILGAALTTLVTELILLGLYLRGSRKMLNRRFEFIPLLKILVACGLMVAVMYPVRHTFGLALLVGSATYVGAILGLRVMGREVIAELKP